MRAAWMRTRPRRGVGQLRTSIDLWPWTNRAAQGCFRERACVGGIDTSRIAVIVGDKTQVPAGAVSISEAPDGCPPAPPPCNMIQLWDEAVGGRANDDNCDCHLSGRR